MKIQPLWDMSEVAARALARQCIDYEDDEVNLSDELLEFLKGKEEHFWADELVFYYACEQSVQFKYRSIKKFVLKFKRLPKQSECFTGIKVGEWIAEIRHRFKMRQLDKYETVLLQYLENFLQAVRDTDETPWMEQIRANDLEKDTYLIKLVDSYFMNFKLESKKYVTKIFETPSSRQASVLDDLAMWHWAKTTREVTVRKSRTRRPKFDSDTSRPLLERAL